MDEFGLIKTYFHALGATRDDVHLGVGDDAAILAPAPDQLLCVSTDTLVSGVHFLESFPAYDIAYKAAAVNLSDMAAMAATPKWATLSLTLPFVDEPWLAEFARGLSHVFLEYGVALVGGDTTKGPLAISLTLMGEAPRGGYCTRFGAKPTDKIYLTGPLGLAALAVHDLKQAILSPKQKEEAYQKLMHPTPRLEYRALLRRYATAALDVSDGLTGDLHHILQQSGVGATLDYEAIPIAPLLHAVLDAQQAEALALSGGDDYELCFCVKATEEQAFLRAAQDAGLLVYAIGQVTASQSLLLKKAGELISLSPQGYQHF